MTAHRAAAYRVMGGADSPPDEKEMVIRQPVDPLDLGRIVYQVLHG